MSGRWSLELRPMVAALYGAYIADLHLELDEVVQDVVERVLRANVGAHPYDPALSAPSTYLMLQARSSIRNLAADRRRRRARERLGLHGADGEEVDAASVDVVDQSSITDLVDVLDDVVRAATSAGVSGVAVRAYLDGHTVAEMAATLSVSPRQARALRARVRQALRPASEPRR